MTSPSDPRCQKLQVTELLVRPATSTAVAPKVSGVILLKSAAHSCRPQRIVSELRTRFPISDTSRRQRPTPISRATDFPNKTLATSSCSVALPSHCVWLKLLRMQLCNCRMSLTSRETEVSHATCGPSRRERWQTVSCSIVS